MHTKPEKWDYVITGKPYGIMRMVIAGVLAGLFLVLTIDQLQPGPNKMPFIALGFGGITALMTVTLVRLIGRYFYYKICIGPDGFYFKTGPFNGKYYEYTEVERCGKGAIRVHHAATLAAPAQVSRQFFHFTDRSGKKREAILEGSLNDDEIAILINRIDHAQKEN